MPRTPDHHVAVEVRDLTVGYERGKPVLDGFSANIDWGVVLVQGANGSGKSTLLEACSGYLPPWRGSVAIAGHDAATQGARLRRRVCRTRQSLYPSMTVRDHLAFATRSLRSDLQSALERAHHYGLEPWLDHEAKALSTGNSRKLWIILCTLGDFEVVLLDEPFNGLDESASEMLLHDIERWGRDGAAVLIAHTPPVGLLATQTVTVGASAAANVSLDMV